MNTTDLSLGIINIIQTFISTTSEIWKFLTQPIFTIDFSFLNEVINFFQLNIDYTFGLVDFSLLGFVGPIGVLIFIILKVITLINPFG